MSPLDIAIRAALAERSRLVERAGYSLSRCLRVGLNAAFPEIPSPAMLNAITDAYPAPEAIYAAIRNIFLENA